ncbi:glycosyltransferase [Oscillospiraceae bacterium MB08-C2-2]|nr:glycosyltransferase [Oscillospiraceae bacterium MB08-C2-2]
MRVALFTETYVPYVNGVVAHVKTLKDGLEKLGHEVMVVTADKYTRHHFIEDGVLHCPAKEVKRLYSFGVSQPISYRRQKLIADFAPDIIHIHHEFGIGLSGILAAKLLKKPLVYTLHTMYDQYIYYIAPRPFLRAATRFSHTYSRFIAKSATELTGPSLKCGEYFKQIGIKKDMSLIPNSVDLDAFNLDKITQEQKDAFREKYGISKDVMLACFVGRLGQEKSVDTLLEYWASTISPADKMHLAVIGEGPERPALEKLAQTLEISSMVTFTGMIPHVEMPANFAACDAYISASLSEMNSISMLEGMATGLPVFQRFDKLNADQIQEGINGFYFHSAEQMAQKLRGMRDMPKETLESLHRSVVGSVVARGSVDLASYMLGVYNKAIIQKSAKPASVSGIKLRIKPKPKDE